MNGEPRRARALACALDLLIAASVADAIGLVLTAAVWWLAPSQRAESAWIWPPAGAAALLIFLLRDARGGRARHWFALEVRDAANRPPGALASIRRNLPLLVPGWNLIEAWPVLRNGLARRAADRAAGLTVAPCD